MMISDLPHDELQRLHREGQISVRANMDMAMHICGSDSRIPTSVKAAHRFWKWLALLMLFGGPISILFIKWYWAALIFFLSFIVFNATRQNAGEFVVDAVLENESLYYDCLAQNLLLIRRTKAPN